MAAATAGNRERVITNTRVMSVPPEKVWEVLADGWLYPLWVVGATRMREVDAGWPAPGTRLHHSVGVWPLVVDDDTEVLACEPGTSLTLEAQAWPAGAAHVVLTLEPHPDGTTVSISEDVVKGPAALVPKPARAPMLKWRNSETLRRLAYLAERR
jgi:uncharacterized protein YndB with AHSA1/START domain